MKISKVMHFEKKKTLYEKIILLTYKNKNNSNSFSQSYSRNQHEHTFCKKKKINTIHKKNGHTHFLLMYFKACDSILDFKLTL